MGDTYDIYGRKNAGKKSSKKLDTYGNPVPKSRKRTGGFDTAVGRGKSTRSRRAPDLSISNRGTNARGVNRGAGTPFTGGVSRRPGIPDAGAGYLSQERARAQARDMRQAALERSQRQQVDSGADQGLGYDDVPMPDFMELLNKALGFIKSQQTGVDYGAIRNDLSSRASEGDSKIASMYRQLQDAYKADGPGIQQSFQESGQRMNQAVDTGIANTSAGFDAARDAQTEQFGALGIGDAAGVLAANGGEAARDQALAKSQMEQLRAINSGQNERHAQSAGTFNTEMGQAAQLGGSFRRGQLASQLQSKLAELSVQEQRDKADMHQNALAQAMGLAQTQNSNARSDRDFNLSNARYEREWADSQADQQYDREADAKKTALEQIIAMQQQETQRQFDPQSVLDAVGNYQKQNNVQLTTDEYIRMLDAERKLRAQR